MSYVADYPPDYPPYYPPDYPPDYPPSYPPPRYPPYHPPPRHPVWPVLLKELLILGIFIANYAHLQWTQKRPRVKWYWKAGLLLLAFVMPSLVLAEAVVALIRVIGLLLRKGTAEPGWRKHLKDWKRYMCSTAGMYVVSDPHVETGAEEGDSEAHAGTDPEPIKLVSIHDPSDLRHHKRPWNIQAILRLLLVVVAVPGVIAAAFIIDPPYPPYRDGCSLDSRIVLASVSSIVCSIFAAMLLISGSEWSMVHLTTSAPKAQDQYLAFTSVIVLAGVLNEIHGLSTGYWDTFETRSFLVFFVVVVSSASPVFLLFFVLWAYVYREEIAARTTLDWRSAGRLVLTLLCLWVVVDIVYGLILDVNLVIKGYI